ncbi:MAG: ABC transporter permease [Muribaculaceae bacterium]|nr:ABC transporter permease [Muribaculaceae bacterium]
MKQFLIFVRKEMMHIVRDTRTMLILVAMPVVLMILFGFALTTEVKNSRLAICDMAKDEITGKIHDRFAGNQYFTLTMNCNSVEQVYEAFRNNEIDIALIIGADFSQEIGHSGAGSIQLLIDGSEPNQASTRAGYAQQILMTFARETAEKNGRNMPYSIVPTTRMLYNPQLKSEYNFVPGVMGMILLLICAMMTSIAIVKEKETGTMEVLLASPLPPFVIIMAKLVPYFVISCVNLSTILLLSHYLLGLPFAGSFTVFLGVSLLYILVSLALGLLISTLVSSQLAAMIISLLLIIPTIYFSGMAFPIESMPAVFQRVSSVIPARWYVSAVRKLMIQGVAVKYVIQETVILSIMAVSLITVSLSTFKKRL